MPIDLTSSVLGSSVLTRFASTSCKALWRCLSCREPFDYFKAH